MSEINEAPPNGKSNTMAIISLISGILSLVFLLTGLCVPCTVVLSLLLGPLGAILGFISKKKITDSGDGETGNRLAIAGIVTGLVGTVGAVIGIIIMVAFIGLAASAGFMAPEIQNIFNSINY